MVQPASASKNIWVAASDGDLDRVRYLIEQEGLSPNVMDSNSYSPMHAAASYAHHELLDYLLSKGGNINLPDDEGDTPLFTVESVETARFLVEHGADPAVRNEEGQTAAEYLYEDHPEISTYLFSLLPTVSNPSSNTSTLPQSLHTSTSTPHPHPHPHSHPHSHPTSTSTLTSATSFPGGLGSVNVTSSTAGDAAAPGLPSHISQQALDALASSRANALLQESQRIMQEAHETGVEPDAQLHELVERAVREGILVGGEIRDRVDGLNADEERKRARPDQ